MSYLNFLDGGQDVAPLPEVDCHDIPSWFVQVSPQNRRYQRRILQVVRRFALSNRRHCGQSQNSAVVARRLRVVESHVRNLERQVHRHARRHRK